MSSSPAPKRKQMMINVCFFFLFFFFSSNYHVGTINWTFHILSWIYFSEAAAYDFHSDVVHGGALSSPQALLHWLSLSQLPQSIFRHWFSREVLLSAVCSQCWVVHLAGVRTGLTSVGVWLLVWWMRCLVVQLMLKAPASAWPLPCVPTRTNAPRVSVYFINQAGILSVCVFFTVQRFLPGCSALQHCHVNTQPRSIPAGTPTTRIIPTSSAEYHALLLFLLSSFLISK